MMGQDSSPTISFIPHIEFECFLQNPGSEESIQEAKKVTQALIEFGCFIAKDPRVSEKHNSDFIDLLETYYDRPQEAVIADAYPEVGFQVGVTPPGVEEPRCKRDPGCQNIIEKLSSENIPLTASDPDPKWRYSWRIGNDCHDDKLKLLNKKKVIPEGFPNWETVMNNWGNLLFQSATTVSEMLAVGFGLPNNKLRDSIIGGSQLLSPTGSDLSKFNKEGLILAGFHYDLSFLTVHGKSRFPGLNIWAKNNSIKIPVTMPEGYILFQAGKQLEWVTGGVIKAGYHEVIVTKSTVAAIEKAREDPSRSLWRVSSTIFIHVQPDLIIEPLKELENYPGFNKEPYPATTAYDYVVNELSGINLFQEAA